MQVIRLYEPPARSSSAQMVQQVMQGRTVEACGVATFPPGSVAHEGERHVHAHDEVFIILAGEITVPIVGGPTDIARAGDWVLVEAGEEHHLTNHTGLPCVALFLILKR